MQTKLSSFDKRSLITWQFKTIFEKENFWQREKTSEDFGQHEQYQIKIRYRDGSQGNFVNDTFNYFTGNLSHLN